MCFQVLIVARDPQQERRIEDTANKIESILKSRPGSEASVTRLLGKEATKANLFMNLKEQPDFLFLFVHGNVAQGIKSFFFIHMPLPLIWIYI